MRHCRPPGGIGCDQLIVIEPDAIEGVDAFMRIFNAEGGEVDACGNATRCIVATIAAEKGAQGATIRTNAGILSGTLTGDLVTVDMGMPRFAWEEIPLAEPFADTTGIELQIGPIDAPVLHTPSVVNVGNRTPSSGSMTQPTIWPAGPLMKPPLFPQRATSPSPVSGPDRIRIKVWERGAA